MPDKNTFTYISLVFCFLNLFIQPAFSTTACLDNFTTNCLLNEAIDKLHPPNSSHDQNTRSATSNHLYPLLTIAVSEQNNTNLDEKFLGIGNPLVGRILIDKIRHSLASIKTATNIDEILSQIVHYSYPEIQQHLLFQAVEHLIQSDKHPLILKLLQQNQGHWETSVNWETSLHYLHLLTKDVMTKRTLMWEHNLITIALSTTEQQAYKIMDIANTQILSGDFKKGSANLSRLNITNGLSIAQLQRRKQNILILQTLLSFQKFSDRLTTRSITELIQIQFKIMHDNEYQKLLQQIYMF